MRLDNSWWLKMKMPMKWVGRKVGAQKNEGTQKQRLEEEEIKERYIWKLN